ncbi:MerR family transcriptional regulator [Streptomyces aureoversilis]|uniref:MerR family transcriptional regulator n=1 Tax=Streptomyces aureoversilis TaxID=67277 RepID=A0ABW0A8H6_9ACTN
MSIEMGDAIMESRSLGQKSSEFLRKHRLLTSSEAAKLVFVTPGCIRQWVCRGYLRPVAKNRKTRAWLYAENDVLMAEKARRVRQSNPR